MEQIAKNEHGYAEYDPQTKVVYYHFIGVFNLEGTKEITNEVMAYSKDRLVEGTCVNLSKLKGTFTAMNSYFTEVYFPALISRGLKCQGIVVPHDVFTKFAADTIVRKMGDFTMRTFGDASEAHEWVLQNTAA